MTYHNTIIIGNLGADPEMRYMQSGTAVCNFSVAVNETWNDNQSGERKQRTTWYRVNVWGAQAESCNKYLKQGSQVMVSGTASVSAYTTSNGDPAASLELRAREVKFLSSNGAGDATQSRDPDDIPF